MPGFETLFDSLPQAALTCAVLALAQVVYVLLGFGAGLVAIGLLAVVLPGLQDAVVLLALVNLPAELHVVRSSWRHVSWRSVSLLLAGVAVGIPAGTWLLRRGEPRFLLVALGAVLAAVGAVFLVLPARRRAGPVGGAESERPEPGRATDGGSHSPPAPTSSTPGRPGVLLRWLAPPVGLLSGLLTGLFGTGGPPLVLFYRLGGLEKAAFRGSLMALFLVMTLVRLPAYLFAGLVTPTRLRTALLVLPAVLAGAWIGDRIHLRIEESVFRRAVSAALLVIGLVLLA